MQTRYDHVDEEQIKNHRDQRQDVDPCSVGVAPTSSCTCVEVTSVENPGDEGDCFLRITSPETTPGCFCPDGTQDDAQAEDWDSPDRGLECQVIQGFSGWEWFCYCAEEALFFTLWLPHAQ